MKKGNYDESPELPFKVGCGGVVMRKNGDSYEVLSLYRKESRFGMEGDSYHLPKGTLEIGESLEDCALREVREEGGAEAEIIAYIGAITSDLWARNMKYKINYTRHFFLMECRILHDEHDDEHDSVDWLSVEDAIENFKKLPKSDDVMVRRAVGFLKSHPNSL